MKHFIGIDLGTTNSAICSYDGKTVRVWKSPEQTDVTPSAIYVDKRGRRYYGLKAYNQAPYYPNNAAVLFKRLMGTNATIELEGAGLRLSPEVCSGEILKVLFGYLPEEIRNDPETATVITVPAAFNQVKKDATLQAAKLAGIGKVALMQEPVAAIMSVMQMGAQEGIFLVYDLGGGTFDVCVAESTQGKVNLLAHGGIEMCGGRDIDRMIFHQMVLPWLRENFSLPEDFLVNSHYRSFCRIAQWAAEQAKMELSAAETSTIALSEAEARTLDEEGQELYLDIPLTRQQVDELMSGLLEETIEVTRQTLHKAGLSASDLERIVFIGGPTQYKPLRDQVCFALSVKAGIQANPMTAVAEGASIFAESIDWSTGSHNRKAVNEVIKTQLPLQLKYTARTASDQARVQCIWEKALEGYTVQFTSLDTGWSSGIAPLHGGEIFCLPLSRQGDNRFQVTVWDSQGREQSIGVQTITIVKTLATVGAIPASHAVAVEVTDRLGGEPTLEFLVREGDPLPKRGTIVFRAAQTLKAGTNQSLNIKLWEGDIHWPVTDNRFIGVLKIMGTNLKSGIIAAGAEIQCDYEMADSGTITLEVSVPSIGMSFQNQNFYSPLEGRLDLQDVEGIARQGQNVADRIADMSEKIQDVRLEKAAKKAEVASGLDSLADCTPEDVQKAYNELLESKKLLSRVRREHLQTIRRLDLQSIVNFYQDMCHQYASSDEQRAYEAVVRAGERAIENNDPDFENLLRNLRMKNTVILFRQDWYVIDWYRRLTMSAAHFTDKDKFRELKAQGDRRLANGDIDGLRSVMLDLWEIQIGVDTGENMFDVANIVKG